MYKLYYMPGRANLAPHIVLQETGAPYRLELVDFQKQVQRSPEYMTLNPNGRVPTLIEDGFVMYEAAAITMYIADQYGEAELAPPPATLSRARYYQWMAYLTNSVQEALNQWFHPNHFVSGTQTESAFKKNAEKRLEKMWSNLDEALSKSPYLLGDRFSACDAYLFFLTCWQTRLKKSMIRERLHLARFFETVKNRPSVRRTFEAEGIASWYSINND